MNDKIEWVMVPREPTEAMWNAGKHFCDGHVTRTIQAYAAMLAAAPNPEAQAAGDDLTVTDVGGGYLFKAPNGKEVYVSQATIDALSAPASHDAQQEPPKDVHTEHCCSRHGCKYGDDDCTVTTGRHPQSYPCEECETEDWSSAQQPAVVGDAEVARYWRDRAQRAEALSFSMSPGPGPQKGCRLDAAGNPMREVSPGVWQSALAWPDAALAPAATPGEPEEYEFEVFQGDAWQAGGSAPDFATAQAEANHYAMMYGQDGPEVDVKFYARREVSPAQKEGNGNG